MAWSLLRSSTDRSDCESCGKNDGAPELTRRGLPRLMSASWREAAVPAAAPYGKLPPGPAVQGVSGDEVDPPPCVARSRQLQTLGDDTSNVLNRADSGQAAFKNRPAKADV